MSLMLYVNDFEMSRSVLSEVLSLGFIARPG